MALRMPWKLPYVSLCAGAEAVGIELIAGPAYEPLCSYQGGKRRLASTILSMLGLHPGAPVDHVLLVDASEWGWIWRDVILDERASDRCAAVLDGWEREVWGEVLPMFPGNGEEGHGSPGRLWDQLVDVDPTGDPAWDAAQWFWLQSRAANGVPIWHPARGLELDCEITGDGATLPNKAEGGFTQARGGRQVGETTKPWQKSPGWRMGEDPRKATRGDRTSRKGGSSTDPDEAKGRKAGKWKTGRLAGWTPQDATQRGRGTADCRAKGLLHPGTIARRIRELGPVLRRLPIQVIHGDVRLVDPIPTARVYFDPPYEGATRYQAHLDRAGVLEVAQTWADAGCQVVVSEAEGLPLEGWHHADLTSLGRAGGKPEWVTCNFKPDPVGVAARIADQVSLGTAFHRNRPGMELT